MSARDAASSVGMGAAIMSEGESGVVGTVTQPAWSSSSAALRARAAVDIARG